MPLVEKLLSNPAWVGVFCLVLVGCDAPSDSLRTTLPAEGGRIEISGSSLGFPEAEPLVIDVPPGAVDAPTEIVIGRSNSFAQADMKEAGPALRIEPVDLLLKKPLQLSLPYYPTSISYLNTLWAYVAAQHRELDNPLKHVVVSSPRRPYQVETTALGGMQSLVVYPKGFPGIADPSAVKSLDVLFVIDDSPSMADKQQALIGKFNSFIDQIMNCTGIEKIHIGVISSNVGLQDSKGDYWKNSGDPGCNTANGDDGKLIGNSCTDRPDPDINCSTLACPTRRSVSGVKFIEINNRDKKTNIGAYTANNVKEAFNCMAYLGEKGCSVESPFEAVKRALKHKSVANAGFFQYDNKKPNASLLVLVFITDEDDCSISSTRRDWSNPDGTKPYVSGAMEWKNFGHDFRCFAMSTSCKEANWWSTDGVKTDCQKDTDPTKDYLQSVDELRKELENEYPRVLVAGIWPMNPTDLTVQRSMNPMNIYDKAAQPFQVELEYSPSTSKTSQFLRLKRKLCANLKASPKASSSPQYRLSTLAEEYPFTGFIKGIPLASYQADICNEDDYGLIAEMLKKALNDTMVTRCGP